MNFRSKRRKTKLSKNKLSSLLLLGFISKRIEFPKVLSQPIIKNWDLQISSEIRANKCNFLKFILRYSKSLGDHTHGAASNNWSIF